MSEQLEQSKQATGKKKPRGIEYDFAEWLARSVACYVAVVPLFYFCSVVLNHFELMLYLDDRKSFITSLAAVFILSYDLKSLTSTPFAFLYALAAALASIYSANQTVKIAGAITAIAIFASFILKEVRK